MSDNKIQVTHLYLHIASDYQEMDGGIDPGDESHWLSLSEPLELPPKDAEMLRITAEYQRLSVHLEGESVELAFVEFNLTPYWACYTSYRFISLLGESHKMT